MRNFTMKFKDRLTYIYVAFNIVFIIVMTVFLIYSYPF